jgi:SAM-dependent methyltransferase
VHPRPAVAYIVDYYETQVPDLGKFRQTGTATNKYLKALQSEEEFPNSTIDASRIASRCAALTSERKFLDVGAGYGFFSSAALRNGFKVVAIEPNKSCREIFTRMNGFLPDDRPLTNEFVVANEGAFGAILLSQVLEHVVDLQQMMEYLKRLLSNDGVVAIAVPHFGSWLSRFQGRNDMFITPPEHLNFFSQVGLISLFRRNGFACCEMSTTSRIDVKRVSRKIRVPFLGRTVALAISIGLKISDNFSRGMFINAYFKKGGEIVT